MLETKLEFEELYLIGLTQLNEKNFEKASLTKNATK